MIIRRKIFQLSLLILFITGLSSSYVSAQNKGAIYCYDSLEVLEISNIIIENELFRENEKEYLIRDSLFTAKITLLETKIIDLEKIINLKDGQLTTFEINADEIKQSGWKWWQYTLAFIGAVTFGFTAGIIYQK